MRALTLYGRLCRLLGPRAEWVQTVAEEARRAGTQAFLVGGPVRDLLLGLPVKDLDLLLADGLETVAERVAVRLKGRAIVRPRFLTATIDGIGFRLDLSQARSETYARPGALPEVTPASISADLERRDFTVNAMALPLDGGPEGALIDLLGGREDLRRCRLAALHPRSFIDDPTRAFRAARYGSRLGFRIAPPTRQWIREAVAEGALGTLSGTRILHELVHLVEEARPERAAAHTERLGLLGAIRGGWTLSDDGRRALLRLSRVNEDSAWPDAADTNLRRACGLRALLCRAPAPTLEAVLQRLDLRGRPAAALSADLRAFSGLQRRLGRPISAGRLDSLLSGVSEPLLLLLFCAGRGAVPDRVRRYAADLRLRPNPLGGRRVRSYGLAGPVVGEMIRAARARALDGRPIDENWTRRWLARRQR